MATIAGNGRYRPFNDHCHNSNKSGTIHQSQQQNLPRTYQATGRNCDVLDMSQAVNYLGIKVFDKDKHVLLSRD